MKIFGKIFFSREKKTPKSDQKTSGPTNIKFSLPEKGIIQKVSSFIPGIQNLVNLNGIIDIKITKNLPEETIIELQHQTFDKTTLEFRAGHTIQISEQAKVGGNSTIIAYTQNIIIGSNATVLEQSTIEDVPTICGKVRASTVSGKITTIEENAAVRKSTINNSLIRPHANIDFSIIVNSSIGEKGSVNQSVIINSPEFNGSAQNTSLVEDATIKNNVTLNNSVVKGSGITIGDGKNSVLIKNSTITGKGTILEDIVDGKTLSQSILGFELLGTEKNTLSDELQIAERK